MIREYYVNFIEVETGNLFSVVVFTKSATISSLHPNYQYNITITAVTVLPGPASPSIVIKTHEGDRSLFPLYVSIIIHTIT